MPVQEGQFKTDWENNCPVVTPLYQCWLLHTGALSHSWLFPLGDGSCCSYNLGQITSPNERPVNAMLIGHEAEDENYMRM